MIIIKGIDDRGYFCDSFLMSFLTLPAHIRFGIPDEEDTGAH